MSARRPPRGAPWLGTLIVTAAIIVICWRAAASLRRAVAPGEAERSRDAPDSGQDSGAGR